MPEPVRIVLAEDNAFLREGLVTLLGRTAEVTVVESCGDYDGLVVAVETHNPDVVVTDLRMPPTHSDEGVRAAKYLRTAHPDVAVLVLSQYLEADLAAELFEHGSSRRGYVLKDRAADAEYVLRAVHALAAGSTFVDDTVVDALMRQRMLASSSPLTGLTSRELDTLKEIATGRNNAAIAESLVISEYSVQKHINSIFAKLGLTDDGETHRRVAAVLLYLGEAHAR